MSWMSELAAEEEQKWLDEEEEKQCVCLVAVFVLIALMLFVGLYVIIPG